MNMPEIQYLGHSCFRLRGKDGVVLTDPYDQSAGTDIGKPTAHIVTVSHMHPHHANVAAVKPLREQLFSLTGPGEYEIGGVLISGVRTFQDKKRGADLGNNTVFVVHLDDIVFCHLGDLGHELTTHQLEEIGNVDVLFVPIGDGETLSSAEAVNVIGQLEPRLVIPMRYLTELRDGQSASPLLEKFLHELGIKEPTIEDKLNVTAASLPPEGAQTRVVVLRVTA
jgi:L-ascorbate metabolism protein UlaG (beta-lactamase superfamily)